MQKLHIQSLSPLHIGSGNTYLENIDFLVFPQEERIAFLEQNKLKDLIGIENLDRWMQCIEAGRPLQSLLQEFRTELRAKDVGSNFVHIGSSAPGKGQELKGYIRDGQGKAYLPGSSLKGAIRTAVLTNEIRTNPQHASKEGNLGRKNYSGFMRYSDRYMSGRYLGKDPNHDVFRFLRIGDAYSKQAPLSQCLQSPIMNLYFDDWKEKKGSTAFFECLPEHTQFEASIDFAQTQYEAAKAKVSDIKDKAQLIESLQPERLFPTIHAHTKRLVEYELAFWREERSYPDILEDYVQALESILNKIESIQSSKQCIIRVGAGAGWDFMTGSWAKDVDKNEKDILDDFTWQNLKNNIRRRQYKGPVPFPKTRKLLKNSNPLFGFLLLELQ